jgi:hypothetical protein
MLRPQPIDPVPPEPLRTAHAAFPQGHRYLLTRGPCGVSHDGALYRSRKAPEIMKLPEGPHDARRLRAGEFGRAEPRDTASWVPSQRPCQVRGMLKLFDLHRDSSAGTELGQDPH